MEKAFAKALIALCVDEGRKQGVIKESEVQELLDYLDEISGSGDAISGSSEIPKDLEEAANVYEQTRQDTDARSDNEIVRRAFIAGYKYHAAHAPLPEDSVLFNKGVAEGKRLMMEEAVEGRVISNDGSSFPVSNEIHRLNLMEGDKVRVIVLKKED